MEEELTTTMQMQKQKTIDKFKKISSKYIPSEKVTLWHNYLDNYYGNTENNEHPMEEVFNYIAQSSSRITAATLAELFMRRSGSFDHAATAAKTIAFFSKMGEDFYKELTTLVQKEHKESIIDTDFAFKLHEINACDDIDEALMLLKVKPIKISIAEYKDINALYYENGFIKGKTQNGLPVIGEKIDNQYAFYIISEDSSYMRFLIHDPETNHINKKRQTTWGFASNNKGEFISKIEQEPVIEETKEPLTLEEYHERENIYSNLSDDHIILPIMREIYELGLPINEDSKTITIQAIMFREMQKSIKLQKN